MRILCQFLSGKVCTKHTIEELVIWHPERIMVDIDQVSSSSGPMHCSRAKITSGPQLDQHLVKGVHLKRCPMKCRVQNSPIRKSDWCFVVARENDGDDVL